MNECTGDILLLTDRLRVFDRLLFKCFTLQPLIALSTMTRGTPAFCVLKTKLNLVSLYRLYDGFESRKKSHNGLLKFHMSGCELRFCLTSSE